MNNEIFFKDNDFKNHILNEKNIPVTENFLNKIFKKYDMNLKVKNLENFQTALTHISYLYKKNIKDTTAKILKDVSPISSEDKKYAMPLRRIDYNTFEYLGDAIIHLILTQYLFERYKTKDQGFLTKLRTKLEKAESLSYLAKTLELDKYVVIARNMEHAGARANDVHLTEDIFEAFMCAVFLENTYDDCKKFLIAVIEKEIDFAEVINYDDNYKDKIMHYYHRLKQKEPKYTTSKKNKINQMFVVDMLNQDNEIISSGIGITKVKAEQDAAYNGLVKLGLIESNDEESQYYDKNYKKIPKETKTQSLNNSDQSDVDYTEWFKDGDFTNHILNEKNVLITKKVINKIFKKYDFAHTVKDINNYIIATTHISYNNIPKLREKTALLLKEIPPIENRDDAVPIQSQDYSRLGHLGNATIHLVLTQYLCKRYCDKDQGFLTKLRIKIEKAETLSILAKRLEFDKYALIAKNLEIANSRVVDYSLTKNIFEAFIGAISLEVSFDECRKFLIKLIEEELDFAELLNNDDNYKDQLMHFFHKMKKEKQIGYAILPKYVDLPCDPQLKSFTVHLTTHDGKIIGIGKGENKSKAEQMAAKNALIKLKVISDVVVSQDDDDSNYYGEDSDDN
jgi:dsRNA-specific ribonuclease